jgi:hypothetical protein
LGASNAPYKAKSSFAPLTKGGQERRLNRMGCENPPLEKGDLGGFKSFAPNSHNAKRYQDPIGFSPKAKNEKRES